MEKQKAENRKQKTPRPRAPRHTRKDHSNPYEKTIRDLQHYNAWRRGRLDTLKLSPTEVGQTLDNAIAALLKAGGSS